MRGRNWASVDYIALDLELTGLDPGLDQVISVGAVAIHAGRIDLSRSIYEQGAHDRPPGRSGVPIHGLRPVDLAGGVTRDQLEERLASMVRLGRLVVWSAWVEARFLAQTLGGTEKVWRSRMIDVRDLVVRFDRLSGGASGPEDLADCAARFQVPLASAHHALGDAMMTAGLFLVIARRLEIEGLGGVRDLRRIGSGR